LNPNQLQDIMTDNAEDKIEEKLPDRPLECSECKKPISVDYTEIIGSAITRVCMCSDCPELQRRLRGSQGVHLVTGLSEGNTTGLACGNCGTTLEALRVGNPLGCSECYEVFDDVLIGEMLASEKIPVRITTTKKSIPIHIGRAPGEALEMNPSLRLLALNEALNETLKREDYEQAAWLRDQIKALTDNSEPTDERK
jgi:protein arginine kinase activator